MPRLMIILGSVREGRVGGPIGEWVRTVAESDDRFEVDFVDLAELQLPMMDEPNHPAMQQYTKAHTKAWSERVAAADGFLFIFPEYNHSYAAPIKNALDYLVVEWRRKPVGFVNWGGNSGGTRAQAALRPVVMQLGMVMTMGNIEINMPWEQLADGAFVPNEQQSSVLASQLDEIETLTEILKSQQSLAQVS